MIDIFSISGDILLSVPISEDAILHQELMGSDYIRLSWNSDKGSALPVGTYVEYNGEAYSLHEPYTPERINELEFRYRPQFYSRIDAWDKMPVCIYTYASDGVTVESKQFDWSFVGSPADAMHIVLQAISAETGEVWTAKIAESLPATIELSSQTDSIKSVLSRIASLCETEYWIDKTNNIIHLSFCEIGDGVTLTVGEDIGVPSVSPSKEGYYTRYYPLGSSRNIPQGTNSEGSVVSSRLTLNPSVYPDGYKDIRGHYENGVFVSDLLPSEVFSKVVIFDDIYPSSPLYIYDVRPRLKYRVKDGEKVIIGGTKENPVYDQYAIWYFKIADFEFSEDRIIEGEKLSVHFKNGQLAGNDFELKYHSETASVYKEGDVARFEIQKGDYEILFKEQNDVIIPSLAYIIPSNGDEIVLFNISMPDEYTQSAWEELDEAVSKKMAKDSEDSNVYEFDSNPVSFYENDTEVGLGYKIFIKEKDSVIESRITMTEKRLDYPCEQRMRAGKSTQKSTSKELQDEVKSLNQNIDVLAAFNDLSKSIQEGYARTSAQINEALLKLSDMFYWHDEAKTTIATNHSLIVKGEMATAGKGTEGSGSGSVNVMNSWSDYNPNISQALGAILGVELHERLTSVESGLSEYATISFVESAISDLIGGADGAYDTLLEIQQILQDNEASIGTILEEIGKKASKEDLAALELRVKAIEDTESEDMFAWADEEHTTIETEKNLVVKGEFSDGGVAENITVGVTSITVDGVSYPDSDRDGVIDLSDAFKNVSVNLDNYYTKEEVYNKQETYSKNEVNELVKGGESDMFAWADEAKTTIKTEKNLIVEGEFSDSGVASNVTVGVTGIVINGETYLDTDRDGLIDLTQALEDLDVDLSDYYTRGEVNGLITGVETKIDVVDEKVIDLKGEWDAFHSVVYVDINGVVHVNADLVVTGDQSTIAVSGEGGSGGYANIGIAVGTEIPEYPNTAGIITLSKELITSGIGLGELAFKDVADLSSAYLPLSGGRMTGTLVIQGVSTAWIAFRESSGQVALGSFGLDEVGPKYWDGNASRYLLRDDNYSNYALPLTGGKINGTGVAPLLINTSASDSSIVFQKDNVSKTQIGYNPSLGSFIYNYTSGASLGIKDDGTPHYYGNPLLHSGNVGEYALFEKEIKKLTSSDDLNSYKSGYLGWMNANIPVNGVGANTAVLAFANARGTESFQLTFDANSIWNSIRYRQQNTSQVWSDWKTLLHSGNYANEIGDYYLKTSGGTINGNSTYPLIVKNQQGSSVGIQITYADGAGLFISSSVWGVGLVNSNADYHGIGVTDDGIPYFGNSSSKYTLIHSNNVGAYAVIANQSRIDASITNLNQIGYGYIAEGWRTAGPAIAIGSTDGYTMLLQQGSNRYDLYVSYKSAGGEIQPWKTIAFTDSDITGYAAGLKHANGTVGAIVNSSGNVGIGPTNPVYKLDVAGDGHFTGTMTLESTLAAGATDLESLWVTNDAMVGGNLVVEGDMSDGGVGDSSTTGVRLLEQWEDRFGSLSGMALGASLGVELYDAMNTSAADITTLYGSLESLEGRVGSLELAGGGGDVDFSSVYFEPNYTSGLHLGKFHVGDSSTSIYMTKYPTFGRITIDNSADNSLYFNSQAFYLKRGRLADSTTLMSIINSTLRFQNIDMIDLSSVMEIGTNGDIYAGSFNGYTLGSACSYSVIDSVTSGSSKLVTSGAVYSAFSLFPSNVAVKNDYRLAFKKTSANDGERWIYIASNNEFIIGYSTNSSALTTRVYGSPVLFHAGSTYTTTNLMMAVRESGIYIPQGKNFSFGTESDNIPMTYKNGVLNIGGDVVVEGDIATTA